MLLLPHCKAFRYATYPSLPPSLPSFLDAIVIEEAETTGRKRRTKHSFCMEKRGKEKGR